jgi:hypothetical protein
MVKDDHGGFPLPIERVSEFLEVVGLVSLRGVRSVLANIGDALGIRGCCKGHGIILSPSKWAA